MSDGYGYMVANVGVEAETPCPGLAVFVAGDVDTGTPTPHVWLARPNPTTRGATVELVGTGLGSQTEGFDGTAWVDVDATSITSVSATGNATNTNRTISQTVIDPAHQKRDVTLPAWATYPGVRIRSVP